MPLKLSVNSGKCKYLVFLFFLTVAVSSCHSDRHEIIREAQVLFCKKYRLSYSSDSAWQVMTNLLELSLPKDMDPTQRSRMMLIKNASILKSFDSYSIFSNSMKRKIDETDRFDKKIIGSLAGINFAIDSIESRKQAYLYSTGVNSTSGKEFVKQYEIAANSPCPSKVK